jgi:hypothetical protein
MVNTVLSVVLSLVFLCSFSFPVYAGNKPLIGVYYFGGWQGLPNSHLSSPGKCILMDSFPERRPVYGWFGDSASVVTTEMRDAVSYGIHFFAFLWYYPKSMATGENRLNYPLECYLEQPFIVRSKLKFMIVYTNHDQWDIPPGDDWDNYSERWLDMMSDPAYLRVAERQGEAKKPVLIIWSPQRFHNHWEVQLGKGAANKALQTLRKKAEEKGLPGLIIGGCSDQTSDYQIYDMDGYDFITGYNYNLGLLYQGGSKQSYKELIEGNIDRWNQELERSKKPFVPTVTSGWDPRPILYMAQSSPIFRYRSSLEFGRFCRSTKSWVRINKKRMTAPPLVLIYAWNEIGEGGYILPTVSDGYTYLKALKKAF